MCCSQQQKVLSDMRAICCTMTMAASSCIVLMSSHWVACHRAICTSTWSLPITTKLLMWNSWHPCEIWGPVPVCHDIFVGYDGKHSRLRRNMGLTLYTLLTTFLWPGEITRKVLIVSPISGRAVPDISGITCMKKHNSIIRSAADSHTHMLGYSCFLLSNRKSNTI